VSDPLEHAGSANGASAEGVQPPVSAGIASGGLVAGRPEIVVGAAFAGGVALAILVRRLGR
jgi:hypothetical protein